jgi:hypothetical protein
MMMREDVRIGAFVRLLSDLIGVPQGTIAKVDSVGTGPTGQWCFTVRYLTRPIGTSRRPISDRSLNLWESDLARFELVTEDQVASLLTKERTSHSQSKLKLPAGRWIRSKRVHPNQLSLFLLDHFK